MSLTQRMLNEKEIYKMSIVNNLKSSILIGILLSVFTSVNVYGYFYHPYYNINAFLYTIVLVIPLLGPAIFVHGEYLILNWGATLRVDKVCKKIYYKDEEKEIEVKFDDVTQMIRHQVKDTALLYGYYEYTEIHLKSGQVIVITNLMARDLSIPGIEIEIVDRYFPSVWWYNNISSQ